jgi:hypothetical protein
MRRPILILIVALAGCGPSEKEINDTRLRAASEATEAEIVRLQKELCKQERQSHPGMPESSIPECLGIGKPAAERLRMQRELWEANDRARVERERTPTKKAP